MGFTFDLPTWLHASWACGRRIGGLESGGGAACKRPANGRHKERPYLVLTSAHSLGSGEHSRKRASAPFPALASKLSELGRDPSPWRAASSGPMAASRWATAAASSRVVHAPSFAAAAGKHAYGQAPQGLDGRRLEPGPSSAHPLTLPAHPAAPQVHLCGSFTRWVETVPMQPVEGQPGTFAVVVHLPPG